MLDLILVFLIFGYQAIYPILIHRCWVFISLCLGHTKWKVSISRFLVTEYKQIKGIILLYDGTTNASVPITVAPNTYINCLGYGICIHEAYNNILDCATVKLPHDTLSMASLSISQDHHRPFVLAQITSLASSAPMSLALHPACPDYDPNFASQPNDFGKSFGMTFHGADDG